jgi:hypothetical protein
MTGVPELDPEQALMEMSNSLPKGSRSVEIAKRLLHSNLKQ